MSRKEGKKKVMWNFEFSSLSTTVIILFKKKSISEENKISNM